ncbi:hypothetical protein LTR66_011347, partial [Elasticomyces elasticus]
MSSSNHQQPMPFGYNFNATHAHNPRQASTGHQPSIDTGRPVLDDHESNYIQDFFNNPDAFDSSNELFDPLLNGGLPVDFGLKSDASHHFDLSNNLTGTVQNLATPVGPPAQAAYGFAQGQRVSNSSQHNINGNLHNEGYGAQYNQFTASDPTADDSGFQAASALMGFQNHAISDNAFFPTYQQSPHDLQSPLTSSGRQSTSSYYTPTTAGHNQYLGGPHPPYNGTQQHTIDAGFGYQAYAPARPAPRPLPFTFGSDNNFNNNGYIAPPGYNETDEERVLRLMTYTESLQQHTSATNTANNTQPTSPVATRRPSEPRLTHPSPAAEHGIEDEEEEEADEVEETRPRKRRKGKQRDEDDDTDYKPATSHPPHHRKTPPRPGPKVPK